MLGASLKMEGGVPGRHWTSTRISNRSSHFKRRSLIHITTVKAGLVGSSAIALPGNILDAMLFNLLGSPTVNNHDSHPWSKMEIAAVS